MTESIFSAFGANAATVETDPFRIPRNKYLTKVTGAEVKTLKEIPYFVIEYTITDPNSDHAGKSASQMLRLIPWTQSERPEDHKTMNARTIGSYKKALLDLGIADNMLDAFNPRQHGAKLLGISGAADIGPNNKGYNNVFGFERTVTAPAPAEAAAMSETVSNPTVDSDALNDLMGNFS